MSSAGVSGVDLIALADGEGYLLRPVMRGMCKFESLKDGSLDLHDVAAMNDALDVDEENRKRITERMNEHGRRY